MKKWLILVLIIALAAIPFAVTFADEVEVTEQEQWFLIRMESNRDYIQKLLDAELITEEEAAERLTYLDERIADVMENGFESYGPGYRHGPRFTGEYRYRSNGRFGGYGGFGGGYCH